MKNKQLTYFLGLVVVVVWGVIIYRIVSTAAGNDDPAPIASPSIKKEPYNDFAVQKDTARLLLNYRDPFGLTKQKDTAHYSVKKNIAINVNSATSTLMKPAFNWGFLQYSGYVRNPGSKKIITLISINGKNEILAEGETKNQVKLIKNMGDSIKISFNGKTKFIPIKPAL